MQLPILRRSVDYRLSRGLDIGLGSDQREVLLRNGAVTFGFDTCWGRKRCVIYHTKTDTTVFKLTFPSWCNMTDDQIVDETKAEWIDRGRPI